MGEESGCDEEKKDILKSDNGKKTSHKRNSQRYSTKNGNAKDKMLEADTNL